MPTSALIEELYRPTHDERARQSFVSMMRKHAVIDMRRDMKREFETRVEPALAARSHAPQTWREIETAMENQPIYRFYSTLRYNAQEMCYLSVQPAIERALPAMIDQARTTAGKRSAGGSLRLNPALEVPRYVTALDVHLAPGCFHREYTADDVAQGAVISFGGKVFTGQHPYRKRPGVIGESIGQWLHRSRPSWRPRRVLDLGTTSGKNLTPYASIFPGIECHGVDVGAPVLRFGHVLAEEQGVAVHFSQQNAESLDYPDAHFDLIVSSFFFHEVPLKSTRRILRECRRLLAPGGIMVHMELPHEAALSAYENFFWNWDTMNNNEPNYTVFRGQDPHALCAEAGFATGRTFSHMIPDFATFGEEKFNAFVRGDAPAPAHGMGGWFVFGARAD